MEFTKMHALGNNYIYVNEFTVTLEESALPGLARAVSDVRQGIGSDGLILIGPSKIASVRMRIFNADGSEAENCGNGLRCVAKYAYDTKLVTSARFTIETKGGIFEAMVHVEEDGTVNRVTMNMGHPAFGKGAVGFTEQGSDDGEVTQFQVGDLTFEGIFVSMGNPHTVIFVDDAHEIDVSHVGPPIERDGRFENRTNVEFVSVRNRTEMDFRVWERGSGITYACGTGACAAVAASVREGLTDNTVLVHLLGGDLEIKLVGGEVWMTGEAVVVCTGEYRQNTVHA